jgi:GDP-D-mannose 3', 5'-epimerase
MNNKPVVVCGAGGVFGGLVINRLFDRGEERVIAVDIKQPSDWVQVHPKADIVVADLSILDNCERVITDARHVYNFVAEVGNIYHIRSHKTRCMLNILPDAHLLIAAQKHGVDRVFYASSSCVYNSDLQERADAPALKESDAYPALPEDGYGWEKLFAERLCGHFYEEYGLQVRIARYHNCYGPFSTYTGGKEKAPAALCRKIVEAKLTGMHEIEIWGDGTQMRSFLYIDDAMDATMMLMESDVSEPLNVGSSEMVSIDQLVDIIENIAGIKVKRKYDVDKVKRGVYCRNSDNTHVTAKIGWAPKTSLAEGLEKTYRWIYDRVKGDVKR